MALFDRHVRMKCTNRIAFDYFLTIGWAAMSEGERLDAPICYCRETLRAGLPETRLVLNRFAVIAFGRAWRG